jgi:MoaA/NifB/PqqE/SkfB family radical SAM enzyme
VSAKLDQVFIEPTVRCNLRCPLCYTGRGDVPAVRDMTYEEFVTILNQLPPDCRKLSLYNFGETLLHPRAADMIRAAVDRGLHVSVSTNFNVRSHVVSALVRSGLHELIVSIDGISQASYATYRVGGHLDVVLSNVRTFIADRRRLSLTTPQLVLQFIVMRHNEHELEAFKVLARELGADRSVIKTANLRTYTGDAAMLANRCDTAEIRQLGSAPWGPSGLSVADDGMCRVVRRDNSTVLQRRARPAFGNGQRVHRWPNGDMVQRSVRSVSRQDG